MAKVCSQCIMPDTYPGISIQDGICNFCKIQPKFKTGQNTLLGRDKLLRLLANNNGDKYHCVIPLSGGKDSSYVAFYVARVMGLNPLLVCFDNGFMTDTAKKNIRNLCNILDLDLVEKNSSINARSKNHW